MPTEAAPADSPGYAVRAGALHRIDIGKDGGERWIRLASFSAWILTEICRHKGHGQPRRSTSDEREISYQIKGQLADGTPLATLTVSAAELARLDWWTLWGYRAVVTPGPYCRDHVRNAIQQLSTNVKVVDVHTHTGWIGVDGQWVYLTAGTCIGKNGAVDGVECDLSGTEGLELFRLPAPPEGDAEREALRASLDLLTVDQPEMAVVLLGAAYRSVLWRSRYILLLTGTSGFGKTTFVCAVQAHFGAGINEGALPATWQSTGYGVIALSNEARQILLLVDDLKYENNVDAQTLQREFKKLVQSASESAGRSRVSVDGGKTSRGGYPRGTIVVTAESAPPGYSNNARLIQINVVSSLLQTPQQQARMKVWTDQAARGVYASAMAGFVRWVAENHAALCGYEQRRVARERLRHHFVGQHVRSPDNIADLAAGWQVLLEYARHCQALNDEQSGELWEYVLGQLRRVAAQQVAHLEAVDPVVAALGSLDTALRTHAAYLVDAVTGGAPAHAEQWGWQRDGNGYSFPHGARRIGYLSSPDDGEPQLWLEPEPTYVLLNERALKASGALPSQIDFWRRVRERLVSLDLMIHETGKNTYRRAVFGSKGRVSLINLRAEFTQVLDLGTGPNTLPALPLPDAATPPGDDERVELTRL